MSSYQRTAIPNRRLALLGVPAFVIVTVDDDIIPFDSFTFKLGFEFGVGWGCPVFVFFDPFVFVADSDAVSFVVSFGRCCEFFTKRKTRKNLSCKAVPG